MTVVKTILALLLGAACWNALKYLMALAWADYPRSTTYHPRDDVIRCGVSVLGLVLVLGILWWMGP
jgi:hypothetical protein